MKKYILVSILTVLILLFIGINAIIPNFTQHRFEIFAASGGDLIDNLVPIKREFPKDIGVQLTLERTPLITENDIESYDWSKHQIKYKNEIGLDRYFVDHRYFVVVVDGICIYYGTFGSDSTPISIKKSSNLSLVLENRNVQTDKRSDKRILNALEELGLLVK